MKKNVERKARERRLEENYNICQILSIKYPEKFQWLKFFKIARKKCLVEYDENISLLETATCIIF